MATPKKKKKLSTALYCMFLCTNSTDSLVTLESMEPWKTLLHAVRIRNHQRIKEAFKEHDGEVIPFVQYHKILLGHTVLHNNPTKLHDVNT